MLVSQLVSNLAIICSLFSRIFKQRSAILVLSFLMILACGPLDRFREQTHQQQAAATGVALIRESGHLATDAFKKIQTLPSYRIESRHIVRDEASYQTTQLVISEYDAGGNIRTQTQARDGSQSELYIVDGQTYVYDTHYEGWIKSGSVTPADVQPAGEFSLADSMHLVTQFGTAPTKSGHEMLNNRSATRYRLEYVVAEMAETFGQELSDSPIDLRGTLWIDDETGALLKSEILLYQSEADQPAQEFVLEISEIGNVGLIDIPSPVVDPAAIAAATATAEAWTILKANLEYRGEQISFEVIPLQATQVPNSSPRSTELQLILRQLPESLFLSLEPFLGQLRQQLTLSIPRRNLVITSSSYRLENSDAADRTADVYFFFNADLEDFGHVELIISGLGNPLFVPVPVERNEKLEIKN